MKLLKPIVSLSAALLVSACSFATESALPINLGIADYRIEGVTGKSIKRGLRLSWTPEAARLVGKTPPEVNGNNVTNPGPTPLDSHHAHSEQEILGPGRWVEATLVVTNTSSGIANFGVAASDIAQTNNLTGPQRDFAIIFFRLGETTTLSVLENGFNKLTLNPAGNPSSVRVRIEFTSAGVRYYTNHAGPSTAAIYVSQKSPVYPLRLALIAGASTQIDNVVIGSD